MGGFVLLHATPGDDRSADLAAALATLAGMGIGAPRVLRGDGYVLAMFPKRQHSEPTFEQFVNGDFVFACGTLIYDGKAGRAAAIAFYHDYNGPPGPRERAFGHYVAIVRKHGVTGLVQDGFGGFHVYCDVGARIASSSFLAVASTLHRVTLGTQSAVEYVFNGVVSGDATLFDEIRLLPIGASLAAQPRGLEISRHPLKISTLAAAESFDGSVAHSLSLLDRCFGAVAASFGDRVTCALSGGYDSRLILALLRRHGVRPRVYVYGARNDADVSIARAIAEGERFALEVVDKDDRPILSPDEFAAVAHANFLGLDGYGWGGIFNNGAERAQRARRVADNAIALNGGGGEIWRNFFYLLDRSYSPRQLLWSFYSQFDPRICTSAFDEEAYFHGLENKLAVLIGDLGRLLPRPLVEWLYHNFRCRAWDGRINVINNTYGYAALPFLERPLTEHASAIPIRWKNHGAYEAELIRRADRRLAEYPSGYGHDFGRPPPLARRFVDYGTYLRPPWLRRFAYRMKHRAHGATEWPGYLREEYRSAVLPSGVQQMNALFRLSRVADPAQLSRILSLEYLARQFSGSIRIEFHEPAKPRTRKCAA